MPVYERMQVIAYPLAAPIRAGRVVPGNLRDRLEVRAFGLPSGDVHEPRTP
ncbi:MAG: hypothetical protein R2855_01490 [Thermomicrobiales bacterium]